MERKEFLRSLGASAAFAVLFPCVHGCSKQENEEPTFKEPEGVDFTFDLESTQAAPLSENGGWVALKSDNNLNYFDVILARNLEGNLVAASKICSHQGTEEITFSSVDGGVFFCTSHSSKFAQDGTSLNLNTTSNPLKIFQVAVTSNLVRIFEG